jgi:hypothetical protein
MPHCLAAGHGLGDAGTVGRHRSTAPCAISQRTASRSRPGSILLPTAPIERNAIMARKKSKPLEAEFVMFDVVYSDGSRTSNRRVPSALLGGLDGDEPARDAIQEQDRVIAEKSGRAALDIETISRSGKVAPKDTGKPARQGG